MDSDSPSWVPCGSSTLGTNDESRSLDWPKLFITLTKSIILLKKTLEDEEMQKCNKKLTKLCFGCFTQSLLWCFNKVIVTLTLVVNFCYEWNLDLFFHISLKNYYFYLNITCCYSKAYFYTIYKLHINTAIQSKCITLSFHMTDEWNKEVIILLVGCRPRLMKSQLKRNNQVNCYMIFVILSFLFMWFYHVIRAVYLMTFQSQNFFDQ